MRTQIGSFLGGARPRPRPSPEARARVERSVEALLGAIQSAFLRGGRHAPVAFRVDGASVQPVALGDADDRASLDEARALLGGADAVVAVSERAGALEVRVERAWDPVARVRTWPVVRGSGRLRLGAPADSAAEAPRLLAA